MGYVIEKRGEQSVFTLYLLNGHAKSASWCAQCHKARRFDTEQEARDLATTLPYGKGESIVVREG